MRAGIVQPGEQKAAVGLISVYSTTGVWSQTAKKTELFFFSPMRLVKHWNGCPKGLWSLSLGIFKTQLDTGLAACSEKADGLGNL